MLGINSACCLSASQCFEEGLASLAELVYIAVSEMLVAEQAHSF